MRQLLFVLLAVCSVGRSVTAQTDTLPRGVIRGVVLDTLGRPAPGAIIQLLTDSAPALGSSGYRKIRRGMLLRYDSTDAEGRFRFDLLRPSRYAVNATAVWMEGERDSLILAARDSLSVEVRMKLRDDLETPATIRAALLNRLAEARARWAARRPARYRLTAKMQCFCPGYMQRGVTFEFHDDSLVGVVGRFGRVRKAGDDGWNVSVPALFSRVDHEIRDRETVVTKLEFDPVYGVPTVLESDFVYMMTDGWFHQYITGFRPIR